MTASSTLKPIRTIIKMVKLHKTYTVEKCKIATKMKSTDWKMCNFQLFYVVLNSNAVFKYQKVMCNLKSLGDRGSVPVRHLQRVQHSGPVPQTGYVITAVIKLTAFLNLWTEWSIWNKNDYKWPKLIPIKRKEQTRLNSDLPHL